MKGSYSPPAQRGVPGSTPGQSQKEYVRLYHFPFFFHELRFNRFQLYNLVSSQARGLQCDIYQCYEKFLLHLHVVKLHCITFL